ncbi:TRAP transporter small permease [Oceanibacterium hippocampi]|uniref:TRAP transporter small permease protein n=1 Tax=Oceanibacterium hippocampi TaxID=745714 RepID=A0A1Y5TI63_9PROT|nr:TRAP transporter small permease subunit [Oceanibacterium hippocampi]SLN64647.1 Tripartite ATP-independent periplasmic transporters, DctQ component [Oceanibacterium hippocampi]
MNALQALSDRMADLVRTIAGILLVVVATSMIVVIAGRYVGFATAWADEVARITFVWCACLGATSGLHRGLHFVVFQIATVRNETRRRLLETLSLLIMFALCAILAWSTTKSIPVASLSMLPALDVSNAWFHSAVTCFALLSLFFITAKAVLVWRRA